MVERLRGTPICISHIVKGLDEQILSAKPNGVWSIKEHIGHLIDLEELQDGRISDFLARKDVLRAADMENIKTRQANHNAKAIEELLNHFSKVRSVFTERLVNIDDEPQLFKSMHPSLQVPMRLIDMAFLPRNTMIII